MESATEAMNTLTSKIIYFIISIVLTYLALTFLVYKTKFFSEFSKQYKDIFFKVAIISFFAGFAFYFSDSNSNNSIGTPSALTIHHLFLNQ